MLRTLEGRAQLAVIALWIAVVASIADAYAHVNRLRLVQDAVNTQVDGAVIALPADVLDRADTYVSITLVASTVTLVAAAVVWMTWQVHAHRRVTDGMSGWRAEPRMSVISWIVPVANLLAPVLVVAALFRAAGRNANDLLITWWLAWIVATVLAGVGTRRTENVADQRLVDGIAMLGDVVTVAAAVLAIGVVRRLTDALDDPARAGSADAQAASA